MARGISIPKIGSGPDSSQRMSVNETRDSIELIAPTPSVIESPGTRDVLLDALVRVVDRGLV